MVIIASHNKEDLKILCDKVIHVVDGKILDWSRKKVSKYCFS